MTIDSDSKEHLNRVERQNEHAEIIMPGAPGSVAVDLARDKISGGDC